ncbi:MAG: S1C family serine protease [Pirellula sp.]
MNNDDSLVPIEPASDNAPMAESLSNASTSSTEPNAPALAPTVSTSAASTSAAAPSTATSPTSSLSPTAASLVASTLLSLSVVLALLGALRLLLPVTLEQSRYSWYRGQLRAEYEASGDQLKQVSIEGLSTVSQIVSRRVLPSVVHITTSDQFQGLGFQGKKMTTGHGSGVIVDSSGLILTNSHVLEEGQIINVYLADERSCVAELLGSDPLTDLAVLKINAEELLPISWGDSDLAEVGSPVWAVGSPFGLTGSITFGIVSSKHRLDLTGTQYDNANPLNNRGKSRKAGPVARYSDLMQTDVAVNPGNSGGPLVNGKGELIGINTAIVGESYRGVSFAIPSKLAKQVFEEIVQSGKMRRGWLGVEFVSANRWNLLAQGDFELEVGNQEMMSERKGAVINRVLPESPAEEAGLEIGDRVIAVNGVPVKGVDDTIFRIGSSPPGSTVELELERNGEKQAIKVKIGQRPE